MIRTFIMLCYHNQLLALLFKVHIAIAVAFLLFFLSFFRLKNCSFPFRCVYIYNYMRWTWDITLRVACSHTNNIIVRYYKCCIVARWLNCICCDIWWRRRKRKMSRMHRGWIFLAFVVYAAGIDGVLLSFGNLFGSNPLHIYKQRVKWRNLFVWAFRLDRYSIWSALCVCVCVTSFFAP